MQKYKLGDVLSEIIDNRGKNPPYYSKSGYYVLDNYLFSNGNKYPEENEVSRFIDTQTYGSFLRKTLKKDDVCITLVGNGIGNLCVIPSEKWVTIQNSIGLRCKPEIVLQDYLYYYLKCSREAVRALDRGSSQPSILQGDLLSLEISLPDIEAQSHTIALLNALDNKVVSNNKVIETSEKLMREIYDYWFVQFDFPDENGRPYKSSGGEMVYNETLKREIPKGWKACNILDVADWVGGAQPPKSTFIYEPRNGYVRFIQNRDYADDNYKTWIPESKSNKICDRLDIMMDKYGDAGRIRFGLGGAYNVALAKIAIEEENLREYIRGFLSSEAIYQYLYNACMASTRASLNEEILGNLNLAIPSEEILSKYQSIAEQNIQLILNLSDENKQLASLRDWLLPMLMNGQIKVSD